jgi:imidazole glycerol-phosphate synthase subunit HisH
MRVALIDYGSGNLHSARKAFELAAASLGGVDVALTDKPDVVRNADRVVLPGVGAFADCKRGLEAVPGMIDALSEAVMSRGRPFLGICVGMQLMAARGLEHGVTAGLGWIAGDVVALQPDNPALKVPHMGWNTLSPRREHELFEGLTLGEKGLHAYFVHSFHLAPSDRSALLATTDYGGEVVAMVGRDNMVGTQFHPEKSQKLGLALIANFLRWTP